MNAALALITQARRILVVTHIEPDGDAIGSLLGLGWALMSLGKDATLACADGVPAPFRFLPGSENVVTQVPSPHGGAGTDHLTRGPTYPSQAGGRAGAQTREITGSGVYDLIIGLDASDPSRYGDAYHPERYPGIPLLVIDHHVTNEGFGTVNLIDPQAAATAEMLVALISELGVALDARIATCLLAGLLADTLGFRTANTRPETLTVAMRLIEAGASLTELTHQLFESKSLASLRVLGRALAEMQFDSRILWTEISQATLRECGATPGDASGIVNVLSSVRDAEVAVVFRERPDGSVDVGMRSAPGINLAPIALRLGGGGHPQAAGCLLPGPLPAARERVLEELRRSLESPAEEA